MLETTKTEPIGRFICHNESVAQTADEVSTNSCVEAEGLTDAMCGRYDVFHDKLMKLIKDTDEDVVKYALNGLTGIEKPDYVLMNDILIVWDSTATPPIIMI